jgi:uncharacterized protein (TIGR02646 family)
MRPVVKSTKLTDAGQPLEFEPWGKAKSDLINEIGSFCSYCEKKVNRSSLHIEHIKGKKVKDNTGVLIYDSLKYRWDNFLLACCNCNSVKDNKDIVLTNPFLPHINNLVHFIEIGTGGIIKIKNGVNGNNLTRTSAFINLVGLDREPSHPNYSDSDDRWENRLEAIDLAKRQFDKYTSNPKQTDLETILCLAKEKGFFSVWYYQFLGQNEVIDALINGIVINGINIEPYKGTHRASFQATNYKTIERP